MKILGSFEQEIPGKTQRFQFDLTSDNHWGNHDGDPFSNLVEAAEDLGERIIKARQTDLLVLAGDNINGLRRQMSGGKIEVQGVDNHEATSHLLEKVSAYYKDVYFLAGNHDLRRFPLSENPWADIDNPENVVMPVLDQPVVVLRNDIRILLGNIFYDFAYIEPSLIGLNREDLWEYYLSDRVIDGKCLINGGNSIELFRRMTRKMIGNINNEVDVVATHCLPHPSLATMILSSTELTPEMERLREEEQVPFIYDNALIDAKTAEYSKKLKKQITPAQFTDWWNKKTIIMGSNILAGDFKPGLISIYGHNHRGGRSHATIRGKEVTFVSHQAYYDTQRVSG